MKKEFEIPEWGNPGEENAIEWLLDSLATVDRVTQIGEEMKDWNPMAFISNMASIIEIWATHRNLDKVEVAQLICDFMEV